MSLTTDQKEAIQESLLAIDDPYYLNTFTNAADEDEWFRLNEAYIQDDLQRYMPVGINTHTSAVWRCIRELLRQFSA